jgi:hypothetical protein
MLYGEERYLGALDKSPATIFALPISAWFSGFFSYNIIASLARRWIYRPQNPKNSRKYSAQI